MAETKKAELTPAEEAVLANQRAQAEADVATAEARLESAKARLETADELPKPLNAPATDALGRKLDWRDPIKARAQQRAAVIERQGRVESDVARVNRGLKPEYATK